MLRAILGIYSGLAVMLLGAGLWLVLDTPWAFLVIVCGLMLTGSGITRFVMRRRMGAGERAVPSTKTPDYAAAAVVDADARVRSRLAALSGQKLAVAAQPEVSRWEPSESLHSADFPVEPVEYASNSERDVETISVSDASSASERMSFDVLRAEHARPALALIRPWPPIDMPRVRSRVGGLPDLPKDVPWPRAFSDEGCVPANAPLHFLAQIDLGEQPWLPEHFPTSGTLLFFGALTDGYFWDTPSDSRVVYDPTSSGEPTMPPSDLEGVDGGYGQYEREFGDDDWLRCRVFPEWPLVGVRIETMPDCSAFVVNANLAPDYADYDVALNDFRAAQLAEAAGVSATDLPSDEMPAGIALDGEAGFPWTARFIGLWARAIRKSCPEELREAVALWQAWADQQAAGAALVPEAREEFKTMLAAWPRAGEDAVPGLSSTDAPALRLVREAGSNAALAALLPQVIFDHAAREHCLLQTSAWGGLRRDGNPGIECRHHQIGGHVPSSQGPMALDYDRVCLAQFQSDYGSEMILCDLGEADFWIAPDKLAAGDFSDVNGETRGG